jgi:hypothetical protein
MVRETRTNEDQEQCRTIAFSGRGQAAPLKRGVIIFDERLFAQNDRQDEFPRMTACTGEIKR